MKVTVIPIVIGHQRSSTGTEGLGNWRTSGDHPNYIAFLRILRNVLVT